MRKQVITVAIVFHFFHHSTFLSLKIFLDVRTLRFIFVAHPNRRLKMYHDADIAPIVAFLKREYPVPEVDPVSPYSTRRAAIPTIFSGMGEGMYRSSSGDGRTMQHGSPRRWS